MFDSVLFSSLLFYSLLFYSILFCFSAVYYVLRAAWEAIQDWKQSFFATTDEAVSVDRSSKCQLGLSIHKLPNYPELPEGLK